MTARLIFLHGGPGLPEYLARFFRDRFPPSLAPTFYEQRRGPRVQMADLLDQLAQVIRPTTDVHVLVGHSWGGVLAIEYLRRNPRANVAGVVLIDSVLCFEDIGVAQTFFTDEELAEFGDFAGELATNLDPFVFETVSKSVLASYDARDFVRTLKVPVLNVFGQEDVRTPARVLRGYADLNPGIENVEVPRTAHFPFVTTAGNARVVDAITDFVSRVQLTLETCAT